MSLHELEWKGYLTQMVLNKDTKCTFIWSGNGQGSRQSRLKQHHGFYLQVMKSILVRFQRYKIISSWKIHKVM